MIPINTTTITVKGNRPISEDPDDNTPQSTLATGVRASITLPSFIRESADTSQVDMYALRCDPTDINRYDTVIDESNGDEYSVERVGPSKPIMFGLQHTMAYIKIRRGHTTRGDLGD